MSSPSTPTAPLRSVWLCPTHCFSECLAGAGIDSITHEEPRKSPMPSASAARSPAVQVRRRGACVPAPDRPVTTETRSSPHPSALFRPCLRPFERVPARSVSSKRLQRRLAAVLSGQNGPGRTRTVTNRAGTALTGAMRTGL